MKKENMNVYNSKCFTFLCGSKVKVFSKDNSDIFQVSYIS